MPMNKESPEIKNVFDPSRSFISLICLVSFSVDIQHLSMKGFWYIFLKQLLNYLSIIWLGGAMGAFAIAMLEVYSLIPDNGGLCSNPSPIPLTFPNGR